MINKYLLPYIYVLIIGLLLSTTCNTVQAQEKLRIDKDTFNIADEGFKEAWREVRRGHSEYLRGPVFFNKALPHYLSAYDYNPDNASLNYLIGACHLYSAEYSKATSYLERAYELDSLVAKDILYLLGRTYHLELQFERAIAFYESYKNSIPLSEKEEKVPAIDKLIRECETGIDLQKDPQRIYVDNLGGQINGPYRDYHPVVTRNDSQLIYTSRRPYSEKAKRNNFDSRFFEDVFVSTYYDEWSSPDFIGDAITTDSHNDAVVGISPDGQSLFVYRGFKRHGDLYKSVKKDGKWSKPKRLHKKNINSKKGHECSASITADGQTLYFVSDRKEFNMGKHDIYYVTKDEKGKWSKPTNFSQVNTAEDEATVYVTPDGSSLYYASNGDGSMGGYDIFVVEYDSISGEWSESRNMGFPLNTPGDELGFMLSDNYAYLTTDRPGGEGFLDLYIITFLGEEKPSYQTYAQKDDLIAWFPEPKKETLIIPQLKGTTLKGLVSDIKSNLPIIAAQVDVIDPIKNEVIHTKKTNGMGQFKIEVDAGNAYTINISSEDYMYYSDTITISPLMKYLEVEKEFELTPIEIGAKIILKNIFFDTGKSTLRPESFVELDGLMRFMKQHPKVKIEISGHTDNRGSWASNQKLSEQRAQSVVNYLIENGINPKNLVAKGYSYDQPVASNDTEEGRQLNRRVEAKIISK